MALVVLCVCSLLVVAPTGQAGAAATYTVTARVSGSGGTVSPASQVVNAGATATIKITPQAGYCVGSLTDNGVGQEVYAAWTTAIDYPVSGVQSNHAITVTFASCERRHDYRSSIDGANLPCTISKPDPVNVRDRRRIPLWVDLHAYSGQGDGIPPSGDMFVLSPWGRNYRGMYMDGRDLGDVEPCLYDDFSVSAAGWTPFLGGNWAASGGCYLQGDTSDNWKSSIRNDSSGSDYTVSVDIKEVQRTQARSYIAVLFRKQPNHDGYWLELYNDGGAIYLRLFRFTMANASWAPMSVERLTDPLTGTPVSEGDPMWRNGVNLKVQAFGNVIEVKVNDYLVPLDKSFTYHSDPSWGICFNDNAFASGSVALVSRGGLHQFDDFRLQNEFMFGESDIVDCINQFLEEFSADPDYRVDPTRIYLSGYSMGGGGTYGVGLHNPDMFSALHPRNGTTDLEQGGDWIRQNYPDSPAAILNWRTILLFGFWPISIPEWITFQEEQDGNIIETVDNVTDGNTNVDLPARSVVREYSARWVLENALNMPVRIEHPEYDSLIPNLAAPYATTPSADMKIWFKTFSGPYTNPEGVGGYAYSVKQVSPAGIYPHAQFIWDRWKQIANLTRCRQETSGYGANGENPPQVDALWVDNATNYSFEYTNGSHGIFPVILYKRPDLAAWHDGPNRIETFWYRASANYHNLHTDPPEVAYKTYDAQHDGAWWLTMECAYPDQDRPALARVSKDVTANKAAVHVKNTKTTTLDIARMGLDNTTGGKTLTVTLDNNTAPEAEPLSDAYGRTTLKLTGNWWPALKGQYQVMLGTVPQAFEMTGTAMTIPDIALTGVAKTLTIKIPAGLGNLLTDPGFESDASGWTPGNHYNGGGSGTFTIDSIEQSHAGSRSARMKNMAAAASPFISTWNSSLVTVAPGQALTASAFVKTRALHSVTRVFAGGKYDPSTNSQAGVAILWLSENGGYVGHIMSAGMNGHSDWSPVEVSGTAPAGTVRAVVCLYVVNPDAQGSTGSAWFDDVTLR